MFRAVTERVQIDPPTSTGPPHRISGSPGPGSTADMRPARSRRTTRSTRSGAVAVASSRYERDCGHRDVECAATDWTELPRRNVHLAAVALIGAVDELGLHVWTSPARVTPEALMGL